MSTPTRSTPPSLAVVVASVLLVVVVVAIGAVQLLSEVAYSTFERTNTLTPLADRLTLRTTSGDVTVNPSRDGKVHVRTAMRHGIGEPTVFEESTGSGVLLESDCSSLLASHCEVDYEIEVPPSFALTIDRGDGNVTARGLTGPLTIDGSAGDISLSDVTGPISASTSSGDVIGTGLRSATVRATSDAGDVRLELLAAPQSVTVSLVSGEIDIAVPGESRYHVDATSESGRQTVTVPVDPRADSWITTRGGSGDIRIRPVRPPPPPNPPPLPPQPGEPR